MHWNIKETSQSRILQPTPSNRRASMSNSSVPLMLSHVSKNPKKKKKSLGRDKSCLYIYTYIYMTTILMWYEYIRDVWRMHTYHNCTKGRGQCPDQPSTVSWRKNNVRARPPTGKRERNPLISQKAELELSIYSWLIKETKASVAFVFICFFSPRFYVIYVQLAWGSNILKLTN